MTILALTAAACSGAEGGSSSLPASAQQAIEAVEASDAAALAALAQVASVPCTTADGLGGPPKCEPGQADGTMVSVLAAASCEGYHLKQGDVEGSLAAFLNGEVEVQAVYRSNGNDLFPAGHALLVTFKDAQFPQGQGRAIFLNDDGVTGLFFGCNHSIDDIRAGYTTGDAVWTP
jgi:hypothetical protein